MSVRREVSSRRSVLIWSRLRMGCRSRRILAWSANCSVFGVCFAVASVGAGGVVEGSSLDVDQGLVVGFEQADQESGAAMAAPSCPCIAVGSLLSISGEPSRDARAAIPS
jgi:hypothetical protein